MSIGTAEAESDAHRGILSLLRSAIANFLLPLRRWYHNSALRLLFVEIRVLGLRMARTLQIREAEQCRGAEEVQKWMAECLVGEPCRQDYILYMQQIKARMPLAIFDSLLVTHAWKAGWESHDLFCKSQNLVDTSPIPNSASVSESSDSAL